MPQPHACDFDRLVDAIEPFYPPAIHRILSALTLPLFESFSVFSYWYLKYRTNPA